MLTLQALTLKDTAEPPDPYGTMPHEFWHPSKGQTQCRTGLRYSTQMRGSGYPWKLKNSQNTGELRPPRYNKIVLLSDELWLICYSKLSITTAYLYGGDTECPYETTTCLYFFISSLCWLINLGVQHKLSNSLILTSL